MKKTPCPFCGVPIFKATLPSEAGEAVPTPLEAETPCYSMTGDGVAKRVRAYPAHELRCKTLEMQKLEEELAKAVRMRSAALEEVENLQKELAEIKDAQEGTSIGASPRCANCGHLESDHVDGVCTAPDCGCPFD